MNPKGHCSTPAMRTHWATDQGFTFRSSQKAVASFIRKLKVRGIPVEVTIHGADGKDVFIPKNRQAEAGKIWKEPSVCGLLKEKRQ